MDRTPQDVHDRYAALAAARGWPAPPTRPIPGECCDRFCDPCVWDYYERALARWIDRHRPDAD